MYQEYFDYSNCTVSDIYTNYLNECVISYVNYLNYGTSHDNYSDWSWTQHSNYSNLCTQHYVNLVDNGTTHSNYVDHTNYVKDDTADVLTALPWNNWDKISDGNVNMPSTYITESIDALKELRDNLNILMTDKGQNSVPILSADVDDDKFDDSDPNTREMVDDLQYDELRNKMDTLWIALKGSSSGLIEKDEGEEVNKTEWESLASKVSELRTNDATSTAGYNNVIDSDVLNGGTGSHSNHVNYHNYDNYNDYADTVY